MGKNFKFQTWLGCLYTYLSFINQIYNKEITPKHNILYINFYDFIYRILELIRCNY
jgi:hypothetical protein